MNQTVKKLPPSAPDAATVDLIIRIACIALLAYWSAILVRPFLTIMVWSWIKLETMTALIFTLYLIPVTLINNLLRPFVMAHGLRTPTLIIFIGVIGGILAHGLLGLFVGPIVLAIAWELFMAWTRQPIPSADQGTAARE